MELRHLRYFVAVAEAENVSRAALKLHVSQPTVSAQVRDLEDEIGVLLLERTGKSVSLTKAGRVFLDASRAVLERADDAVRQARESAGTNLTELHVGYSPIAPAGLLPAILRAYQRAMPNVQVRLHDRSNQENLAGVRDGRLQLAFVFPSRSASLHKLRIEEVAQAHARLAVSRKHPLARRRVVSLADAAREPFIGYLRELHPENRDYLFTIFAPVKIKPRIVEEHENVAGVISAVEAGSGVSLATDTFAYVVGNRVKLLRLDPEPQPVPIYIAAPKARLSPAAEQFWRCATEVGSGKRELNA